MTPVGCCAAVPGGQYPVVTTPCGGPVRNVKLGDDDFLLDRIGSGAGFHLIVFTGDADPADNLTQILAEAGRMPVPVVRVIVGGKAAQIAAAHADLAIADSWQRVATKYDATPGTVYLIRPDMHVCARWRGTTAVEVREALLHAIAAPGGSRP